MTEKCEDCGRPKAEDHNAQLDDALCFQAEEHDHSCWVLTIRRLRAQLAAAQAECEAWRALAEHLTADGVCGSFPYKNIHGRWFAYSSAKADTNYELDVVADTPQAAAIDLATKLGLLPNPTKASET